MSGKILYFIASPLPGSVAGEIREFQEMADARFHSKKALNSPPHITLVPPFQIRPEQAERLRATLANGVSGFGRIPVVLDGFSAFDKRVIFVDVIAGKDLEELAVRLNQTLSDAGFALKSESRPFHPHVTVAFKDLRREAFDGAFGFFRGNPYSRRFDLEKVALLEYRHGRWIPVQEYDLS